MKPTNQYPNNESIYISQSIIDSSIVNHSPNNLFTSRPTKCIVNQPDSQPTRQTCRRDTHKQGKKQTIATKKSSERKGNESQGTWRNDFEKESRREQTRKAKEKKTRTPSHGRNLCTNPCVWSSMLETTCFWSLLAMKVYTTWRLGHRCRFGHEVIQHLRGCLCVHDLPITLQEAFCTGSEAFMGNIQSDVSWTHARNRTCCRVTLSDYSVTQLETSINQSGTVLESSFIIQLSHPELVLPSCYAQENI